MHCLFEAISYMGIFIRPFDNVWGRQFIKGAVVHACPPPDEDFE